MNAKTKKILKYIGIAICVYAFFYLATSFIIWDFDSSVMQPSDRAAMVFYSTLVIGAIIYITEIVSNI